MGVGNLSRHGHWIAPLTNNKNDCPLTGVEGNYFFSICPLRTGFIWDFHYYTDTSRNRPMINWSQNTNAKAIEIKSMGHPHERLGLEQSTGELFQTQSCIA